MSRSDKDAPFWVRAEWWTAQHWGCQYAQARRWGYPERTVCDLPAEPDRRLYLERCARAKLRGRSRQRCTWEPVYDHHPLPPPPRWFVGHVYHWPQRQASRVDCLNATKEYRATGEVDTIPTVRQARHDAKYYWW